MTDFIRWALTWDKALLLAIWLGFAWLCYGRQIMLGRKPAWKTLTFLIIATGGIHHYCGLIKAIGWVHGLAPVFWWLIGWLFVVEWGHRALVSRRLMKDQEPMRKRWVIWCVAGLWWKSILLLPIHAYQFGVAHAQHLLEIGCGMVLALGAAGTMLTIFLLFRSFSWDSLNYEMEDLFGFSFSTWAEKLAALREITGRIRGHS